MQGYDGGRLKAKPGDDGSRDLLHDALEARSRHQELCRTLVPTDLLESQRARSEPLSLLDTVLGGLAVASGCILPSAAVTLARRGSRRANDELGRRASIAGAFAPGFYSFPRRLLVSCPAEAERERAWEGSFTHRQYHDLDHLYCTVYHLYCTIDHLYCTVDHLYCAADHLQCNSIRSKSAVTRYRYLVPGIIVQEPYLVLVYITHPAGMCARAVSCHADHARQT